MNTLVFGASGTIGTAVTTQLKQNGNTVVTVSNTSETTDFQMADGLESISKLGTKFNGCVWAQGLNMNDTLLNAEKLQMIFSANVFFIIDTLKFLMEKDLLENSPRLVIVSSVWQKLSRKNKFSYSLSKSALHGLVSSVMSDFSHTGLRINAVLPGVIDSSMSRLNLSDQQLSKIELETPTQSLVTESELAKVISWLLSEESSGVNGQFINVDNGWSHVRTL